MGTTWSLLSPGWLEGLTSPSGCFNLLSRVVQGMCVCFAHALSFLLLLLNYFPFLSARMWFPVSTFVCIVRNFSCLCSDMVFIVPASSCSTLFQSDVRVSVLFLSLTSFVSFVIDGAHPTIQFGDPCLRLYSAGPVLHLWRQEIEH